MAMPREPQLTFAHECASRPLVAGPGARAHARHEAHATALAAASPENPVRFAALEAVRARLHEFIARLGIGAEFQAVDFLNWLDATGQRPSDGSIDLRASGGLFLRLRHTGVLVPNGYRPNCGGELKGYSSTPRVVWKIARLPTPKDAL